MCFAVRTIYPEVDNAHTQKEPRLNMEKEGCNVGSDELFEALAAH